jgi:hypothetical protein
MNAIHENAAVRIGQQFDDGTLGMKLTWNSILFFYLPPLV